MGGPQIWVPKRTVATQDPQPYYALNDQTGELVGPIDPGTVGFRDPVGLDRWHADQLNRAADVLLEAAAKSGRHGLDRALRQRFPGDPRGLPASDQHQYLRRMLYSVSGGAIAKGFLGDGGDNTFDGFDVDDSKDNTAISGYAGGAAGATAGGDAGFNGSGPGRGERGMGGQAGNGSGAGGGGYGTAGGDGTTSSNVREGGFGGQIVGEERIWSALRQNSYTADILEMGGGGGGGGSSSAGGGKVGGIGGTGGAGLIRIALATLTISAGITKKGVDGGNSGFAEAGSGGGGAGGLVALIAAIINQTSGTLAVDGGAGQSGGQNSGAGGDGRIVQVYYLTKDTLTVTGAQQNQFQILRSPTSGLAVTS